MIKCATRAMLLQWSMFDKTFHAIAEAKSFAWFNWQMSTFRSYDFCSKCTNMSAVFDLLPLHRSSSVFFGTDLKRQAKKICEHFSREFQLTTTTKRETKANMLEYNLFKSKQTLKYPRLANAHSKGREKNGRKCENNWAKKKNDPSAFVCVDHSRCIIERASMGKGDKAYKRALCRCLAR